MPLSSFSWRVCKFRENNATFSDLSGYGEYLFPKKSKYPDQRWISSSSLRISAARNSPINTGPASLFTAITYNVNSLALYAPSGATLSGFSAAEIQFQGSSDGVNWTVLYSTTTIGSVAEVLTSISSNLTTGNFQQHRLAIQSQGQPIAVAQAQFNVLTTGQNERMTLSHARERQ
jgi:hypothetical protein